MSRTKTTTGAARAVARLAKQVEVALAPLDLSLPQYRVLALLGDGSTASSVLARKLAVSPPSVTAVVDGLVAAVWSSVGPIPRTGAGSRCSSPATASACSRPPTPRPRRASTRSPGFFDDRPTRSPPGSTAGTARSTATAKRT